MKGFFKAHPLQPGDSVAIATPGARLTQVGRTYLEKAVSILEGLGFDIKAIPGPHLGNQYFAGEDRERAEALTALFSDPEIRAIFCARGGYGSQRIIPFLDPHVIQANPKIFVGSSDITALLIYLLEQCHLIPFHGPNVATNQFLEGDPRATQRSLRETLELGVPGKTPVCKSLKPGIRNGKIKGGCLSLLVTTIGTPYEIDLRGAILFVEDFKEPLYRIDRMLTHLKHTGKLDEIEGLVLGEMVGCEGGDGIEIESMILDLFWDQDIPIILGFPSGHGRMNLTIPLGVDVTLDGCRGCVVFNESGLAIR